MKNEIKIIIATSILCFSFSFPASAARLYFEPSAGNFSPDAPIPVDLKIDTENQQINSVEGNLIFSSDIFSVDKLSDGNSIISFWVNKAKVENGTINFSGVIPGGYVGPSGLLLKIYLKPAKEGSGTISVKENSLVLLNDGQGTAASVKVSSAMFNIKKSGQKPVISKDTESPEAFNIQVAKDSGLFDGKWFLVFVTQDKKSGIDYYEVKEVGKYRFWELGYWIKRPEPDWRKTDSPYLLTDQGLRSDIYVRAVDKSGNGTVSMLSAQTAPWYREWPVYIIFGITIFGVIILIKWLWIKKIRK